MNLFVEAPDYARLTSMHFYAWKRGLKTGMYYLRTRPAADAIPFTLDPTTPAGRREGREGAAVGVSAVKPVFQQERDVVGDVCLACQG